MLEMDRIIRPQVIVSKNFILVYVSKVEMWFMKSLNHKVGLILIAEKLILSNQHSLHFVL